MVNAQIKKRGISAFNFNIGEFVPANHANKSMVAECDVEVISPKAGVPVQSFDRKLIDVDAVQPTASEAVCMSVARLKTSLGSHSAHNIIMEEFGIIALLITGPIRLICCVCKSGNACGQ